MKELGLSKAIIQQRANQLVRELNAIEETADLMRMLHERRNRAAIKKQGFDRSLTECHNQKVSLKQNSGRIKNGGVQTGLRAFFASTKSVPKKAKVVIMSEDDTSTSGSLSAKKATHFFKVVPGKRDSDSPPLPGSPKKKLRTVVNEDGVIELVSVPDSPM